MTSPVFLGEFMKQQKNKFITLTLLDKKIPLSINVSHIIDIEPATEPTFIRWKETRKTWFGFGKDKVVNRSSYDGLKVIEGCKLTTTQLDSVSTRYYGEGSRGYQSGGGSTIIEIKESREDVLKLINEAKEV